MAAAVSDEETDPAAGWNSWYSNMRPGDRLLDIACGRGGLRTDTYKGLTDAGFADVRVVERPAWRTAERGLWQDAAAIGPGDDPDLRDLHDEATSILPIFDLLRRVLATATAE